MTRQMRGYWIYALMLTAVMTAGCGTTKSSDTARTATEQLLISDSVDRAVSQIDFEPLAEHSVYLDKTYIDSTVDKNYVISTLRQHMLASGCIIKDEKEEADFVVEVRSGSLGTNRNEVLLGIPATNLPSVGLFPTPMAAIPEIALAKQTKQQAVCKIAVFAYERETGRPVWQSGNRKVASGAKDTWLAGTGPFQKGEIYDATGFAGEQLRMPMFGRSKRKVPQSTVGVERVFDGARENHLDDSGRVEHAGYASPSSGAEPQKLPPRDAAPMGNQAEAPSSVYAPAGGGYPPPTTDAPPYDPSTPGVQGNVPYQATLPPSAAGGG